MKTVYIVKSELDGSFVIKSTNNFDQAIKNYQKIKKVGKMEISLWELLCNIQFTDDRRADNFAEWLQSDVGKEFIITHFTRNSLLELKKLLSALPKSCPVYIIGGLAIDGYMGKLTREHNDADLLCWRKDIETIKSALKKIGFKTKIHYLKDETKKAYYIETNEENPIISFLVMDKVPNNSFEISIGKNLHQVFPKKYLSSKKVVINDVKFPVVGLELLDYFNKKTKANLNRIKKENPKLYSILGLKIINNNHDRKLLNELMKK
ncbi:MAG: hypothetical protein KKD35_03690 [Elusimicrobia bacterium]|nr:hypothetical protein [Elusimicrobiota bacterium]